MCQARHTAPARVSRGAGHGTRGAGHGTRGADHGSREAAARASVGWAETHDDDLTWTLFHSLDRLPGPHHLEHPDGFDRARAGLRAARLRDRLTRDFGRPCRLDEGVQDASFSFSVDIPAEATGAGVLLAVRLSNYGDLAVVTPPAPGSHDDLDDAVRDRALSEADRDRITAALSDLGYRLVPPRLLHRPYDGVTWLADESHATWWTRFFDHL
ncbi:hypothetical protein [Streptomyces sp. NRRL WC-3744]|uniref:hypothetical protein n=1 Tax=Streptomyces sp. NRRL WC-3744 TaxID=1463935 RepID=UPI000AF0C68E|nr:hypothetical protein [Streptomyces sp. NRRL WC-3744]